jgi:hypothetical protein
MAWKRGQCFFQVSDKLSAELAVDAVEYAACILTATVAEVQTESVRCSRGARGQPQAAASRVIRNTCVFPPPQQPHKIGKKSLVLEGIHTVSKHNNLNSSVSTIHAI